MFDLLSCLSLSGVCTLSLPLCPLSPVLFLFVQHLCEHCAKALLLLLCVACPLSAFKVHRRSCSSGPKFCREIKKVFSGQIKLCDVIYCTLGCTLVIWIIIVKIKLSKKEKNCLHLAFLLYFSVFDISTCIVDVSLVSLSQPSWHHLATGSQMYTISL